jgi:hypothetical protein
MFVRCIDHHDLFDGWTGLGWLLLGPSRHIVRSSHMRVIWGWHGVRGCFSALRRVLCPAFCLRELALVGFKVREAIHAEKGYRAIVLVPIVRVKVNPDVSIEIR